MFYWVVKAIIGPFLRLIFRPLAEGTDNVPRTGPAILASNHLSFSDHFFAPLPPYSTPDTEEQLMLYRSLSTPGLMSEFEKQSGPIAAGEDDKGRARAAAYLIRTRKPNLLLLHIFDLDHEQHLYGPGSPESFRALERDDACLGTLRQEIAAAGLANSTRWIVVSDHGFLPVHKAFQPNA